MRVRKLARELKRSPAQLLGLLHHLGYTRYKSEEDMVGGAALTKVRAASRKGLKAEPVLPTSSRRPTAPPVRPPERGLMDQLVPGVVPQHAVAPVPKKAGRTDAARTRLEADRAAMETERAQVSEERRTIDEDRALLDARRRDLDERRADMEQKQATYEAEREALRTASPASLAGLLGARGLKGFDEQERALAALASGRQLGPVLTTLIASDPARMARLLQEKLVLVDTEVGEGFPGLVSVAVSSDRAEVPRPSVIASDLDWIGAQMLLCGLKRLLIIGGEPRWQGVIRSGFDPRIGLTFAVHGRRSAALAERDVETQDVIVRWPADIGPEAQAIYRAASCVDIGAPDGSLKSFLAAMRERLAAL